MVASMNLQAWGSASGYAYCEMDSHTLLSLNGLLESAMHFVLGVSARLSCLSD